MSEKTFVSIGNQILEMGAFDELKEALAELPFEEGKDYEFCIAGGDDLPHGILLNDVMFEDATAREVLADWEGPNPYGD